MKCTLVAILLIGIAVAQAPTNAPSFTVNLNFLAGNPYGASMAVSNAVNYRFTTNSTLRADLIVMPSPGYTGYFGGVQYDLAALCPLLAATSLNCGRFLPYVNGAVGLGRVQSGSAPAADTVAALIRTGANYDPTGSGRFTLNLYECGWGRFGVGAVSSVFCQTGISFGMGTNIFATQAKIARMQKAQAKRIKKMQAAQQKARKS